MYREYKEHIIEHEKHFNNRISEANQHFGLNADQAVRTFEHSMALAENHIRTAKTVHALPKQKTIPPKATFPREEVNAKNVVYLDSVFAG